MSQDTDMDEDLFAETAFGKAALQKLGALPKNFRLYEAGWIGKRREDMEVKGRVFRRSKAGRLVIPVPGTCRRVVVTVEEMRQHRSASQ